MDGQGQAFASVSNGEAPGANPLIPFFGYPLSANQLINPNFNLPHEAIGLSDGQDFSDLYKGPSPFMSITLQALIVEADEWPTRVLMPWYHTDKVNIGWQVWKFDRTLADLEPEQGVPRYITTEYEHKSSRMLRRGLAFQLEHGFWSTEEGKLNYAMNIQTIRSAVHETVYQSILHSLLNEGQALTKFYNARYNVANFTLKTALEFEKWRFGIVNKQQHGLELIDAELSKYLSREAVKPDVWVFPPKMKLYTSYVTPSALEVFRSGDALVSENRKASQQLLSDTTFAGKQVFESREYAVDFSASPIDQLSRERQTGDYFLYKSGSTTLVYDADYDDFMPVDDAAMSERKTGVANGDSAALVARGALAPMSLLSSGSQMSSVVARPAVKSDRERLADAGYSAQQIDNVFNCARCFQLAHLNHSSAAGFAADLNATAPDVLARASAPENAMNMATRSDASVVMAIEGRGDISPEMRVACSLASGIVAGVPHSMLGMRYANVRGSEWYKNLHAAYDTAKAMNVGNRGYASEATLRHAAYNGVDADFVNFVAANVDSDSKLTQIAIASASGAPAAETTNNANPLAWGALDAIATNLNVDDLSPVAIASLRNASAAVDGFNMHGDAQSTATTLASVKRHWDARMSDDYVSGSEAFLGVRRAQAKSASFAHFLKAHVFSKNDAVARAAAGSHADAAASASLNAVSTEGAAVWNNLVKAAAQQQGWPTSGSVPQTLNAWKLASASAAMPSSSSSASAAVSVPLAFRASEVVPVNTQVESIASSSTKPITINESDAWAAVSFPFAGVPMPLKMGTDANKSRKEFYKQCDYTPQWEDIAFTVGAYTNDQKDKGSTANIGNINISAANSSAIENGLADYKLVSNAFNKADQPTAELNKLKGIVDADAQSWPAVYVSTPKEDADAIYKVRAKSYFAKITNVPDQENIENVFQSDKTNRRNALSTLYASMGDDNADNQQKFIKLWEIIFSVEPIEITVKPTWIDPAPEGYAATLARCRPLVVKAASVMSTGPSDPKDPAPQDPANPQGGGQVDGGGNPEDEVPAPKGDWYLIERPFKTFRMGTGILARGGETLGLTFYGHCNFQWSNNTTNKVHEGHFTFYSRPVVRDWRQYAIAEDIFVLGYVRGEVSGCQAKHFIDAAELKGASAQTLHEIYAGQKGHLISYRLNKVSSGDKLTDVRRTIANPHSITGDWSAFERQYEGSPAKPLGANSNLHWNSAAYYQQKYKRFYDALTQENSRISGGGFAVAPGTYNTVVWETQYTIMDKDGKNPEHVEASDCLPHYYRGRAQAISGMSVFLQDPRSSTHVRF